MTALKLFGQLGRDRRGATVIEFALLAPAFIVMLLGVVQVGIGFQNYNALRSLSADVARYAMVENAQGGLSAVPATAAATLKIYADGLATGTPYLLDADRLDVTIVPAATQRVTGATELTLTIDYEIPSMLSTMGLEGPEIDYQRPIFLATP